MPAGCHATSTVEHAPGTAGCHGSHQPCKSANMPARHSTHTCTWSLDQAKPDWVSSPPAHEPASLSIQRSHLCLCRHLRCVQLEATHVQASGLTLRPITAPQELVQTRPEDRPAAVRSGTSATVHHMHPGSGPLLSEAALMAGTCWGTAARSAGVGLRCAGCRQHGA